MSKKKGQKRGVERMVYQGFTDMWMMWSGVGYRALHVLASVWAMAVSVGIGLGQTCTVMKHEA